MNGCSNNKDRSGILLCQCARANLIPQERLNQARHSLVESEVDVWVVDDLCHLSARSSGELQRFVLQHPNLKIMACHERAVKGLLHRAGIATADSSLQQLEVVHLKEEVIGNEGSEKVCDCKLKQNQKVTIVEDEAKDEWAAWFPVIDYDRCTSCGQCSSFCLFGVYEQDTASKKVRVVNPENCKNNCPACARACPDVAIMFPKLEEAPINGAPVNEQTLKGSHVKVGFRKMRENRSYQSYADKKVNPKRQRLVQMLSGSSTAEVNAE